MSSKNFFLDLKMGSDLLLVAAGEKVGKQKGETFSP